MRLPWPFGRSESDRGASSGSGADAGGGAPGAGSVSVGAASSPAEAPIRPTGAWRTLPPIQRSSGPPPVVAPAAPFLADVPGHAPLPPIVTPLGHESSPSAPVRPRRRASARRPEPHLERAAPREAGAAACRRLASPPRRRRRPGRPRRRRSSHARRSPRRRGPAARAVDAAGAPELPPIRTVPAVAPSAVATPASRPLHPDGALPVPVAFRPVRRHDAVRGGRATEAGRRRAADPGERARSDVGLLLAVRGRWCRSRAACAHPAVRRAPGGGAGVAGPARGHRPPRRPRRPAARGPRLGRRRAPADAPPGARHAGHARVARLASRALGRRLAAVRRDGRRP